MSARLPVLRPDDVVAGLEKAGWYVRRQKGSHLHKLGSMNIVVIPMHHRDVPKGTLRGIVGDAGLIVEEFAALVKK
ncbi:MAG: type II toxin-antitoxin system HicA family toxin [Chloroflexi bacterium]|nr:type II toxin-antitoxin system HicA family toxin [Chloroflexota bacterium]